MKIKLKLDDDQLAALVVRRLKKAVRCERVLAESAHPQWKAEAHETIGHLEAVIEYFEGPR